VMDDSLRELVLAGRVSPEEARRAAENPGAIPSGPAPASAPPPAGAGGTQGKPAPAAPKSAPPVGKGR
jgi:hypothetical protein